MAVKRKTRTVSQKAKSTTPKKSTSEVALLTLFDSYKHADAEVSNPEWIQMPNFQRYAVDIGVTDPESFKFLHLMLFLECPACGVMTRDSFVRVWTSKRADTLESQSSLFIEESNLASSSSNSDLSPSLAEKVYLHAFILFSTPIPSAADAGSAPFSSKPGINIPLDVAVEIWTVLFKHPTLAWATDKTDWVKRWIEFLRRTTNSLKENNDTTNPNIDTDDDDEEFKPVTTISKHVWGAIPSFARKCRKQEDLEWWDSDQNWPTLIDDFVVWVKANRTTW